MPADTAPAWPDPARHGVPTLPEVDAFHWLLKRNGAWPEAWLWQSDADGCGTEYSGAWAESDSDGQPDTMARWYSYLGPCLTPAEVAAREAAAWAAGAAAMREIAGAFADGAMPTLVTSAIVGNSLRALPLPPMPTN